MEQNQNSDLLATPPKRSETLNVLTILTFIGCGLAYIGACYNFIKYRNIDAIRAEMDTAEEKAAGNKLATRIVESSREIAEKTFEYRYILLISALVFTTFCLIGAIQMRKLKKSGYPIYVIGELAPLVISAVLIGFSFTGSIALIFSAVFSLLFVILYSIQRKNLVY